MKVFIVLALCAVASTASVKSLLDGVTFTDVSGRSYTLDDFRGKYLALYHSASWCGPCRRFTPKLINAYNALLGSNFQVIWITEDRSFSSSPTRGTFPLSPLWTPTSELSTTRPDLTSNTRDTEVSPGGDRYQ